MDPAAPASPLTARRSGPLQGRVRVPGDKSISLRSLILGAMAVGETRITGMLEGEDAISTANAMRALGALVERTGEQAWRVMGVGVGGFAEPRAALDFGNSGTGCRLAMGAVAGCPITATFDGDASLRTRPMRRILDPLEKFGARTVNQVEGGRLPLTVQGALDPIPVVYEVPVPSAQVKSAVLLAGLAAPGTTTVIENEATRDHTEKMLKHFGAHLRSEEYGKHGRRITLTGQPELEAAPVVVPADPSSAAFPMVAALIVPGSEIMLDGVMTNPLRAGLLTTLREMGAGIEVLAVAQRGRRGRRRPARARRRRSRASTCRPSARPTMIDEYPILAVAAAFAEGVTRMRGLKELRVKESDRLEATAALLRNNGVTVEIEGDDLIVHGKGQRAGRRPGRDPHGSPHRDVGAGARHRERGAGAGRRRGVHRHQLPGLRRPDASAGRRSFMIIAIDGPAASGKGTLGKRLAAHYGLRHLDTGLLYRAVAKALLDAGHSPNNQARAVAAADALDPAPFDEAALKSHAVGEAASLVSAIPDVRAALLAFQRNFANRAPGAVLDGRDIGTVICPHARGEDFRHRDAGGAGTPPRPRIAGPRRARRRRRDPRRYPAAGRARHVACGRAAQAGGGCAPARHHDARRRRGVSGCCRTGRARPRQVRLTISAARFRCTVPAVRSAVGAWRA